MDYRYGSGADEVDEFFRTKRSWSNIKDKIVGDYIDCYLNTVHKLLRPILIVDGFAGPGRFGDDTLGSPLIICKAIDARAKGGATMSCLFADSHPGHRLALESNLADYIHRGICERPYSDWTAALTRALELGKSSTIFFYLDPYGIKELEFEMVRQIYERDTKRSTEVLINFNFRTFMRMSGNWNYGDSADEISRKVKAAKTDRVNKVMDGDYWQAIVTDPRLTKIEREDEVVRAYLDRIRKFFKFAYSIPVKERRDDEYAVPHDELARYHLIFGTRNSRAVKYMNDVAHKALEPYFSQFKEGLLFDMTPERHQSVDAKNVKDWIVSALKERPQKRSAVFEMVISQFFMQYRTKDYRKMIDDLTFREGRLFADKQTVKQARRLNDDTVLSAQPSPE